MLQTSGVTPKSVADSLPTKPYVRTSLGIKISPITGNPAIDRGSLVIWLAGMIKPLAAMILRRGIAPKRETPSTT
jgi:aromatic ring-cleaving dioxygenase